MSITDDTYSTAVQTTNNPYPENPYAAKFSLQFCIAAAIVLKDLSDRTFTVENINNPQAIRIYDANHQLVSETPCPSQLTGYEYEVRAAAECIRAGKTECPAMPHEETIHMMELMDHIRAQMGLPYPCE